MIALVLGGSGRLGRRLVPALAARGHVVHAPTRIECNATLSADVRRAIGNANPDVIVSLVAYADVPGCDRDPDRARRENVAATGMVAGVAAACGVPMIWTSTDYVVEGGPTPAEPKPDSTSFGRLKFNQAGVYTLTKNDGEGMAIANRATVARVAFCCPEDAERWAWVDGYNLASREWVERTAERLAILAELTAGNGRQQGRRFGEIVHVGPIAGVDDGPLGPWRTREQLVRARFGDDHPALRDVIRSPAERDARGLSHGPGDTRFARCDPRLALSPG